MKPGLEPANTHRKAMINATSEKSSGMMARKRMLMMYPSDGMRVKLDTMESTG